MNRLIALLLVLSIAAWAVPPVLAAESTCPVIESEAAVLMDAQTGQVIFARNMHEQLSPASITKIMTILLGIEHGRLNDTLTMSHQAIFSIERGSSHIALDQGEQINLEQALMATMLASANEAANGIAEYVSGSIPAFVNLMNQRAMEAGALHTHFVNPNGLYADDHLTTAYDMAVITRAALQDPDFRRIFASVRYEIPPTNKQTQIRYLWAEHKMFPGYRYQYDGMIGGKTGYTQKSQNTLVTAARRGDRELIAVVIRSMNSAVYTDTKALLDYGFDELVALPVIMPAVSESNLEGAPQGSIPQLQQMVDHQERPVTRLLHHSLTASDLVVDYTTLPDTSGEDLLRVNITLKNPSPYMYGDLGAADLGVATDPGNTWWKRIAGWLGVIARIAAGTAAALIMFLLTLKAFFTLRRKIRRRVKAAAMGADRNR